MQPEKKGFAFCQSTSLHNTKNAVLGKGGSLILNPSMHAWQSTAPHAIDAARHSARTALATASGRWADTPGLARGSDIAASRRGAGGPAVDASVCGEKVDRQDRSRLCPS
jgi:hypothetical protein